MTQDRLLSARFFVPDSLDQTRGLDRLIVRDLVIPASIGVHAHERLAPQRVRVNIDLLVRNRSGEAGDDIAQVISYEDLINGVRQIVDRGHINLVETLAEEIGSLCLEDPRSVSVSVKVEKPDIITDAEAVGIEIVRHRPVVPAAEVLQLPREDAEPTQKAGPQRSVTKVKE